jgi:cell division ATPase FtsA
MCFGLIEEYESKSELLYREIISSGIVLTGGAASMHTMTELAKDVFQSPIRIGTSIGLGGLVDVVNNPMHATCKGLIQYSSNLLGITLGSPSSSQPCRQIWSGARHRERPGLSTIWFVCSD